ncbi:hypothetical protein FDUTEX481_00892 [Tolypothrix sp. PCC 7601]|nr:hypothetical protein FDUTEX481_00892 [Tolypothrix sp. PCC 7601]
MQSFASIAHVFVALFFQTGISTWTELITVFHYEQSVLFP